MKAWEGRHPSVTRLAPAFEVATNRMPDAESQAIATYIRDVAEVTVQLTPDCPELTRALNQLLNARELFLRAIALEGPRREPLVGTAV